VVKIFPVRFKGARLFFSTRASVSAKVFPADTAHGFYFFCLVVVFSGPPPQPQIAGKLARFSEATNFRSSRLSPAFPFSWPPNAPHASHPPGAPLYT